MAKSMKDQLSMLNLMTSEDLPKSTSSQVSADGHMQPNLRDGPSTNQFGRGVAPANHSALPETKKGRKTKDISGPPSLASLKPVGPMWLWESRLRQRLASLGSTECSLTWKASITPQGRPLFRLVPSTHRTAGTDFGLWRSPQASEATRGPKTEKFYKHCIQTGQSMVTLTDQTRHAMWPTPSSRDGKGGYQGGRIRNGKLSNDTLDVTAQHTGQMQVGLEGQTANKGGLNPQFVCWLMGFPPEWESYAPTATPSSRKSRQK